MKTTQLFRLIGALVVLAVGVFLLYQASTETQTVYPKPAPEDQGKVFLDQAKPFTHYDIVKDASIDAVTRFPRISDDTQDKSKWVLVSKARAAACVS